MTLTLASQIALTSKMLEAKRLHGSTRLREAQVLYEEVLAQQPNNSEAIHLLGFLKVQSGHFAEAIPLLKRAVKANRGNAAMHLNLADCLKLAGEIDEARHFYKMALKLDPTYVEALVNYGGLLLDIGRYQEALVHLDKSLTIQPGLFEALNNRGSALLGLRHHQEAIADFDRAIAASPRNADAYYNRGVAELELGRAANALASFNLALALQSTMVKALNNRANALLTLRQPEEALADLDAALALAPDYTHAFVNRGNVLRELNRNEEALASYDRALKLQPDLAIAFNNKGDTLSQLGRFAEAQAAFEAAIALDPSVGAAYVNLALVKTFAPDDAMIRQMERLLSKSARTSPDDRTKLHYALGKIYEGTGDRTRAFAHVQSGARIKRSLIAYDEAAMMRLFDGVEAVFNASFIAERSGLGHPSARPIFILGMPRSGTTLIEQILASHAQVFGAGELSAVNEAVNRREIALGASYPDVAERFGAADLQAIANDYLASIDRIAPDAVRVTDKMPSNFFFLGLIHLIFPNARIIHTIRNPIDICVSCYSILFSDPQDYSYDLGELGRYYRRYEALMAHWRRVLPAGRFIDIAYEDVVADLETAARKLIAACDLPWDDACLAFHAAQRTVRTASVKQVRQPIYTSAVGRWRRHAAELQPLLEALGLDVASDGCSA